MAYSRRLTCPGTIGLLVALAGVAILFHDLAGKPIPLTVWGSDLDPRIIIWTVEWGYHTIFERMSPLDVWNANVFFPYANSLAFLDSMLTAQLLYAPLRLLGFNPVLSLYITAAGFCIIGAVLTDRLLRGYGFSAGERALVIVCAHFSLPTTAFLIGHYQFFGMQLAPPFFLTLHRLLNAWRGKDLVLLTALFCAAGGFATYFVPMTGSVALITFFIFSIRADWRRSPFEIFRSVVPRIAATLRALGSKSVALSILMLSLFVVVQLLPYLSLYRHLPPQPMSETYFYSGRPWSVFLEPSGTSFWYTARPGAIDGYWERAAFPGFPLLVLAAAGLVAIVTRATPAGPGPKDTVTISLSAYAVVILAISWVLSWGPYLQLGEHKINLPFLAMAKLVPGVQNIRAPGRFAMFYGLPLGLLAVVAVRTAARRFPRASLVIATVLPVLILIDQMPRADTYPSTIPHADFFRAARSVIREGEPLIQLPLWGPDPDKEWSTRISQMESSIVHWARLVAGAGSRSTPEQNELRLLDAHLWLGDGSLNEIAAFARRLGIKKLVVFPRDYPPNVRVQILSQAEGLGGTVLLKNDEGLILLLGD